MVDVDRRDVAELFGDYGGAMVRAARALVRSEADAEDAVQDAMVALLSAAHLPSIVENVGGWLYTLVRRRCVDLLRRGSSRRSDQRESTLEALFDEAPDASALLEQHELVASVAQAVRMLDEPLRFAFVENA